MTPDEIGHFMAMAQGSGLTEFTVTIAGCTLTLRNPSEPGPATISAPEPEYLCAPAAGVFRTTQATGEIVAFLQVGPCLRAVVAPEAQRIGPSLVADGTLVGYGTALFALEASR